MLQLGLETDHVPQGAERIVLAQLDHRIGPAACARVVETDALHRAVAQRFDTARRHHLDRHAAFEVGRVLLPLLELGLFALVQRRDEGLILVLVHRAVDVVLAALVPARGHPADVHVDAVAVNDRGNGVEEGEGVAARDLGNGVGQAGRGQRAGGDDGRARRRQGVDPFAHHLDVRMSGDPRGYFGGKGFAVHGQRRSGRHAMLVGRRHDQRVRAPAFPGGAGRPHYSRHRRSGSCSSRPSLPAGRSRARASCRHHRAFRSDVP